MLSFKNTKLQHGDDSVFNKTTRNLNDNNNYINPTYDETPNYSNNNGTYNDRDEMELLLEEAISEKMSIRKMRDIIKDMINLIDDD